MTKRQITRCVGMAGLLAMAVAGCDGKPGSFFDPAAVLQEPAEVTVATLVDDEITNREVTLSITGPGEEQHVTTTNGITTFRDLIPRMYALTTTVPAGTVCERTVIEVTLDPGTSQSVDFHCYTVARGYSTQYQPLQQDCFAEDPESFTVQGTFTSDAQDANLLSLTFEGVDDAVTGPFDPLTGRFTGESQVVEVQPGITGQESWDIGFRLEGMMLAFNGGVRTLFTFTENGATCFVDWDVTGTEH